MIKKRKILRLITMIGFFLFSLTCLFAGSDTGMAISVKPILPPNQHDPQATYYDLRMNPGQEQDLKIELINTSEKEQQVTLQVNDATTNETGDIDYSDRSNIVSRDKSLKIALKDIATTEPEIVIPANKTITTTVHLKMPNHPFDGMILGGIKVVSSEKIKEEQVPTNKDNQAKKTYIVAVKLTETDTPVEAKLNLVDIIYSNESNRDSLKATIQNERAVNLEDIEYVAEVYEKGSDKILKQSKVTGYRMAPNSSFTFIFDGENKELQSGTYQMHLTAKSKATNQEWEWEKEFDVKTAKAKTVSAPSRNSEKDHIMLYTIIFVSTFVALLLLLLILLISRKRKEKRYEEALYQRNKKRDRNKKNVQHNRKSLRRKNVGARKKKKYSTNPE
ncbi:DUF916 and DUF3324 domain-containing protein [Enterococcus caccae]|uniref:Uncharacterized protein n=1 Tax=Enterococcus caccae ATCC BAA-1240 TaxID=1158612 RepID=R3WSS9_9ENTE|nr:DUF916 and DUF3324 domain-containing protein [Enterococcus caccae]EOL50901.1 hypothetical protein UC7_00014 [Enterococcus caccae ATCC BAA-1240]EOT59544.1 hypothetical protein I580_02576 [Enterococcus caccae ATCC BAA-1240]OJG23586.1 hypothetical protein RU98_GL001841 [Enterococcus caccae]